MPEIFTVGFCFGGRPHGSLPPPATGRRRVGFYGSTVERNGAPGPTQRAAEFEAPILALQAGDDANILPEHNAAFDAALTEAGVEHELVVYDGAPHSFFDRKFEEHADASADAWGGCSRSSCSTVQPAADGSRRTICRDALGRWIADIASSGQTRIAVRMLVSRIERIMALIQCRRDEALNEKDVQDL